MSTEVIRVSGVVPAAPERIFKAWLNSNEHSAMTGSRATVEPHMGGRFTAWDGYIEGRTLEIEPFRRIGQSWRSSEFPAGHPDSRLEIMFEPSHGGTLITFVHSELPAGQ